MGGLGSKNVKKLKQICCVANDIIFLIYSFSPDSVKVIGLPGLVGVDTIDTVLVSPYRGNCPPVGNSGPGTLFDRKNFCFSPSDIALVLYWG